MTDKEFLPQYAAQAVIDLEKQLKQFASKRQRPYYWSAVSSVAMLIRHAVHVVLPPGGEIYRSNHGGGDMPSEDECASFAGLPAPVTCFEYSWHRPMIGRGQCEAPRRITIVSDGKQTHSGAVPLGMTPCATILSVFYNERHKAWQLADADFSVAQPMRVAVSPDSGYWGVFGRARNLATGKDVDPSDPLSERIAGEFKPDITAIIQCCHALRAGASFEERVESSAARRWKFDKRGVGGFTYHILKLPGGATREGVATGTHDSPRFHIRRAHIRKLPTGVLTFVRQCFVGDAEKGVVAKHYKVGRP